MARRPQKNRADVLKRQAYAAAPKIKDQAPCRERTGESTGQLAECPRCDAALGEACRERAR